MNDKTRELESPLEGIDSPLGMGESTLALSAPVNVVAPYIIGTPIVGQTIYADTGGWVANPYPSFTYQWNVNGVPVPGETNDSYVVQLADVGQNISVTVFATNSEGSSNATSASVVGIAATARYLHEDSSVILLEDGGQLLLEA